MSTCHGRVPVHESPRLETWAKPSSLMACPHLSLDLPALPCPLADFSAEQSPGWRMCQMISLLIRQWLGALSSPAQCDRQTWGTEQGARSISCTLSPEHTAPCNEAPRWGLPNSKCALGNRLSGTCSCAVLAGPELAPHPSCPHPPHLGSCHHPDYSHPNVFDANPPPS